MYVEQLTYTQMMLTQSKLPTRFAYLSTEYMRGNEAG